jgi:nitric oxide dioxygenase
VWYEDGSGSKRPVADAFAGMMDLSQVTLPDDAAYYLCGPLPFLKSIRSALIDRGVPPQDIQYEVFGPDLWQADTD